MKIKRSTVNDVMLLLLGTALITLSIQVFVIPNNLASNGVSGLSVVLYHAFQLDPALTFLLFNIPLLFFGFRLVGKKLFFMTILGSLSLSGWLFIWEQIPALQLAMPGWLVLAGICDGIVSGVGIGLALRSGGSSGGSAILSLIFHSVWATPINRTLFVFDAFVMGLALFVYLGWFNFIVTLGSCLIASQVVKLVADKHAKAKTA